MSSKGLVVDTNNSITRLAFSSITPRMTMLPYIKMNMYIRRAAPKPKSMAVSVWLSSLPWSVQTEVWS